MELHVVSFFVYFNLMLAVTHAALPPDLYWKSVLPSTPMPKAITKLLNRGYIREPVYDDRHAHIVKWGQNNAKETEFPFVYSNAEPALNELELPLLYVHGDNTEHPLNEPELSSFYGNTEHASNDLELSSFYGNAKHVSNEPELSSFYGNTNHALNDPELSSSYGITEHASNDPELSSFYGNVEHALNEPEFPISHFYSYGNVQHALKEFSYGNAKLALKKTRYQPKENIFFLEEDIRPGTKLNLHFSKSNYGAPLLPRQIFESITFSKDKMEELLNELSIKPNSENAKMMKMSITYCEAPPAEGEEKICPTSLESMVDFVISKFGKNVHAISTEVESDIKIQKISIQEGVKKLEGDKAIVCHRLNFPYVTFLCHKITKTSTYFVPLEAENGARVKAIAICHKDTSKWNSNHLAFQVLNVKPGTTSVCHFSYENTVVWLPK